MTTATAELAPGIYPGLSMAEYLALPYMSASGLEVLRRSPRHYRHAADHPDEGSTQAQGRGTALHLAILEPELFDGRYVVLGQCAGLKKNEDRCTYQGSVYRDGKSYCGTHDPAKGEPADQTVEVISAKIHDEVLAMRDAVKAHPRAKTLFQGRGDFEVTLVWEDKTGVVCKIRPDRLIERVGMHVNLTASRDAAPWAFPRQAEGFGYWRSMAFYRRGLRALGWPYRSTSLLAVEAGPPADVAPYLIDEDDLTGAEQEVERLLRVYRTCEETGHWPGYAEEFQPLSRPAWANDYELTEV